MGESKKPTIGWLGAGRMGYDMAKCLAKAGYDITVWNRTRAKAEPLAKEGAKIANHPSDLASCDFIFSMLATADDVNAVILGPEGLLSKAKPGQTGLPTNLAAEAGHDPLVGDAGGDAELIPELEFDQTLGW